MAKINKKNQCSRALSMYEKIKAKQQINILIEESLRDCFIESEFIPGVAQ